MVKATWLVSTLRDAGLTVIEEKGWETRGRGEFTDIKGAVCHHTAGAKKGNAPSLALVRDGRPDLAGPLSQLVLGRDGTWYVVASGRSNHAGRGKWQGITSGNSNLLGIEAENTGKPDDPWPPIQMQSYIRGVAAILRHIKADDVMAVGHKEWALPKGRKTDPTFDMVAFRENVGKVLDDAGVFATIVPIPATNPIRAMLKKGDMGLSVKQLQRLLKLNDDGNFGPMTEAALKRFQKAHGLLDDGKAGPATWRALGVK